MKPSIPTNEFSADRPGRAGSNRNRLGVQGNSHDIGYLNARFSRSSVGVLFKPRRALSPGQSLFDFDLEYCNGSIGNRCAVQSINQAFGSVTNQLLPCFFSGLAGLSLYNIQTGWNLK